MKAPGHQDTADLRTTSADRPDEGGAARELEALAGEDASGAERFSSERTELKPEENGTTFEAMVQRQDLRNGSPVAGTRTNRMEVRRPGEKNPEVVTESDGKSAGRRRTRGQEVEA